MIILASGVWSDAAKSAKAAENPAYTLKKGKKAAIKNIIANNPLTKADKGKCTGLKWKSSRKKVVKVIGNKKIKGLKKGSAYIRGEIVGGGFPIKCIE